MSESEGPQISITAMEDGTLVGNLPGAKPPSPEQIAKAQVDMLAYRWAENDRLRAWLNFIVHYSENHLPIVNQLARRALCGEKAP